MLYAELIDNYERFGTTRYVFTDDTFNDSKEKLQAIYDISKKLPFKLEYWAYVRLDLLAADPETINLLYGSGCIANFFGIETFNKQAGSFIGKGGSREKLIATVKKIKNQYGNSVTLHAGFIFGLPYEDVNSIKQTHEQLVNNETGLDVWYCHPLIIRSSKTAIFSSDIDKNYKKYGYRITGFDNELKSLVWENDLTSFDECKMLASQNHQESIKRDLLKVRSNDVLYMSSLGIDPKTVINQSVSTFDWHSVTLKKEKKIQEYKQALYSQLNLT